MQTNSKLSYKLELLFSKHRFLRIEELNHIFEEKSFALSFIFLMMPSALPIPTGGFTNILEVITMLFAVELILGRTRIWLPKRLKHHKIHSPKNKKTVKKIVGFIKFFEKFSRPRGHFIAKHHLFVRLIGLIVLIFAIAAFFAPVFSGLDTLPSLGIVIIGLGLMLDDLFATILGIVVGSVGVTIMFLLTDFIINSIMKFFT